MSHLSKKDGLLYPKRSHSRDGAAGTVLESLFRRQTGRSIIQ